MSAAIPGREAPETPANRRARGAICRKCEIVSINHTRFSKTAMKTTTRITLCLALILVLSAWSAGQEKATSTITVLVPVPEGRQEETKLSIGSALQSFGGAKEKEKTGDEYFKEFKGDLYWKKFDGEGEKRVVKLSLEKGKEYKLRVQALAQPNNYEAITRYKEITIKGGEDAKVDLSKKLPTDRTTARWVPTPEDIVDQMAAMAKVTKDDVIYDLGCGDAVMLIRPMQKIGAKRGVGIDINPKMVKIAKDKVKEAKLQDKIEIREGDILDVKDMSEATVVLLYIGDVLGERLSPVLKKTMKPGARIVSHRFSLGDWKADKMVTVKGQDGAEYDLLLWTVPERKIEKK
jgi:precorrin-6B methylase 2